MSRLTSLGFVGAACCAVSVVAAPPSISGCQIFPSDHIFNTRIDSLPVHPHSADFITRINSATRKLHLDLGMSEDMKSSEYYGIPYNVVSGGAITWQPVFYTDGWPDESDCAKADHSFASPCVNVAQPLIPIPVSPLVEGGIETNPANYGDHHILTLDKDSCVLWETYHSYPHTGGGWDILSSARFDLKSNALRPAGWTSSDAAGFPILPLLLRADEASSGEINHALRFTIQSSKIRNSYTWPATHLTNNGDNAETRPPMGQLFRLKADYVIPATFNTQSRAILTALKRYGMYIADGGSDMYIQGEPSAKWEEATISQVQSVPHTAFEAVDLSPIQRRTGFDVNSARVPPEDNGTGGTAASFNGKVAGSSSSLTLDAHIDVAAADKGGNGQLFVAAWVPVLRNFYALTSTGWRPVNGLEVPAHSSVLLGSHDIPILQGVNIAGLGDVVVYAGYGANVQDMLNGKRYGQVYPPR